MVLKKYSLYILYEGYNYYGINLRYGVKGIIFLEGFIY